MFLFLVQRPTVLIDEHGHVECHKAPLYQRSRSCVTERPQEGITIESSLHGVALSLAAICVSTATDPVWTRNSLVLRCQPSQTFWAQPKVSSCHILPCTVSPHHAPRPSSWGKAHWGTSTSRATEFSPRRVPNSGTPCGTPCGAKNHLRKL